MIYSDTLCKICNPIQHPFCSCNPTPDSRPSLRVLSSKVSPHFVLQVFPLHPTPDSRLTYCANDTLTCTFPLVLVIGKALLILGILRFCSKKSFTLIRLFSV